MIPMLGAIQSPYDPRDWPAAMTLAPEAPTLPSAYRLSTIMSSMPVVYEQTLPSCVHTSICGVAEFHERIESGGSVRLDDERFYWRTKELGGNPGDGEFPRVALEAWRNEGIYSEVGRGPDHYKIRAYYAVPCDPVSIARVIYEKRQPVLIAGSWPSTWFSPPASGVMPAIIPGSYAGGHQTYAWGYDFTQPNRWILRRNSWSKSWGLNGNFWSGQQEWEIPGLIWECWYAESL